MIPSEYFGPSPISTKRKNPSFSTQHLHHQSALVLTSSNQELEKIGATPALLSLESASVTDLTHLLKSNSADAVLFAAGAGGKGDPGRTRKVDYEGAVKVYDAMESGNVKRLVVVGAVDIRDRSKGYPEWYNEDDSEWRDESPDSTRPGNLHTPQTRELEQLLMR
jgi:nucleoside-diphosphate-sugar epimerase